MSKRKIKELFNSLSKEEQIELLKELNPQTGTSIAEFTQLHQRMYGKNVEFTISQEGVDHMPTITAIVHTAIGDFEATGSNKKIAKANAVELAAAKII